jgi:hypothetical protein
MTCEVSREWLLNAEKPACVDTAPADIASHIRGCAQCQKLEQDLAALEEQWRQRPLPASVESAKVAFLKRLESQPAAAPHNPERRRAGVLFWAIAASLFIVAGISLLFFFPGQPVAAHPDVIDQLVDWNLDMSQAPTQADRQRIYVERQARLQDSVGKARLGAPERDMAQNLLENGSWLAQNQDPVEELQRLNKMADDMLERVNTTNSAQAELFAKQFRKINERGIDPTMERVHSLAVADPERRKLINRILRHDKERAGQIAEILEKSPDITKKDLRKALDLSQKRHKHKKD